MGCRIISSCPSKYMHFKPPVRITQALHQVITSSCIAVNQGHGYAGNVQNISKKVGVPSPVILFLTRLIHVALLQLCQAAGRLPLSWLNPACMSTISLCLTRCQHQAGKCFKWNLKARLMCNDKHTPEAWLRDTHKRCIACELTCCRRYHAAAERKRFRKRACALRSPVSA